MGAEPGPGPPVEAAEGEYALSLRELLRIILRRLWVILLLVVVAMGTAVGLTLMQTPVYEASIKIVIGQEQGSGTGNLQNDVQGLQALTPTMVETVNTRHIAEAVIQQLDLQMTPEEFVGRLNAQQIRTTQLIQVTYKDPSPEKAQLIANTVGDVFSEQISETKASANAVTATVWEQAAIPSGPVSPNLRSNIGAALVIGLMLGMGLVFLLEYLNASWRSPEEAERISGVPTLGIIPEFKALRGK